MQYKTHATISLVVTLPIMTATNSLVVGNIAAVLLGSVFPDIDEPHSWIGCRTRGTSDILNKIFGHRGLTHSLTGLFLTFMTLMLMINIIDFKADTAIYFILGYALHLVEDSFSKSGIKWLLPFSDTNFHSGMRILYYTTGSVIENLILLGAVGVLIFQIKTLDFSIIQVPNINIFQMATNLINKIITIGG